MVHHTHRSSADSIKPRRKRSFASLQAAVGHHYCESLVKPRKNPIHASILNNDHCQQFFDLISGFQELYPKFSIRDAGTDQQRLPSSSTCVNLLKVRIYHTVGMEWLVADPSIVAPAIHERPHPAWEAAEGDQLRCRVLFVINSCINAMSNTKALSST